VGADAPRRTGWMSIAGFRSCLNRPPEGKPQGKRLPFVDWQSAQGGRKNGIPGFGLVDNRPGAGSNPTGFGFLIT
jgi:hypothetical protein